MMTQTRTTGLLRNILNSQISNILGEFLKAILFSVLFFVICSGELSAKPEVNQFISIVNPVRNNSYTVDIVKNLESQSKIINDLNFPATWLLTYDILEDNNVTDLIKNFGSDQELGIFLEVTPNYSEKSGVTYNKGGSWHSSNSIFLSGYRQEERIKLIDTVFAKFKENFGYYPVSVGSWWTDSFSLSYMIDKYGVTSNLVCADQYSTDGYQIWGQYWSQPYYPSRLHAAVPGRSGDKLNIVNVQWAPRDPLNGYYNSLYSTQDYSTAPVNEDIDYFGSIVNLYAKRGNNNFGHAVIGLESDLSPHAYEGEFKERLSWISDEQKKGEFQVLSMKDFSGWFRESYPDETPIGKFIADDLKGDIAQIFWYQSTFYRIGFYYDKEKSEVKIFDLRIYSEDTVEPYFRTPNSQFDLSIYVPSLLDGVNNEDDVWKINAGKFLNYESEGETAKLDFDNLDIKLGKDNIEIVGLNRDEIPVSISESKTIRINEIESGFSFTMLSESPFPSEGVIYRDLSAEATHLVASKKVRILLIGGVLSFLLTLFYIFSKKFSTKIRLILLVPVILVPVFIYKWYKANIQSYLINQSELEMLWRLSTLPDGYVMVYDNECLQCEYYDKYKPPAFANKRNYVRKYGGHGVVYNKSVFEAADQKEAGDKFERLNAQYVYLVKHGEYTEKLPFSPGDLGVKKLYSNAYSEIWKKVE